MEIRYSLLSKGKYLQYSLKTILMERKALDGSQDVMRQWQGVELEHIVPLLSFTFCANPYYLKQSLNILKIYPNEAVCNGATIK